MAKLFNIFNHNEEYDLSSIPDQYKEQVISLLDHISFDEFIKIGQLYQKCYTKEPRIRRLKYPEVDCEFILEKRKYMNMKEISKETGLSRATLHKRIRKREKEKESQENQESVLWAKGKRVSYELKAGIGRYTSL